MASRKYFKAKVVELEDAIDSTGQSHAKISSAGDVTTATLRKALGGERIMKAKGNAIILGINHYTSNQGVKYAFDSLFYEECE